MSHNDPRDVKEIVESIQAKYRSVVLSHKLALEQEERATTLVQLIMMTRRVVSEVATPDSKLKSDAEELLDRYYAELKTLIGMPELKEYAWSDKENCDHVRVLAYNEAQAKEIFKQTLKENDCYQDFEYQGCITESVGPAGLLYNEWDLMF